MHKTFLILASTLGALTVMIGAFGAHALKAHLTKIGRIDVFETAVKYQFYHTIAIFLLGLLLLKVEHRFLHFSGYFFSAGILIFSGSLYMLCLTNVGKWGAVTPFGGLLLIAGWIMMAVGISKAL